MGVYLCLGQPIWKTSVSKSIPFQSFEAIHEYMKTHSNGLFFLGEGKHKIKKKAEQLACELAIQRIKEK